MNRLHPLRARPWAARLLRAPWLWWRCYRTCQECGLRPGEARRWATEQVRRMLGGYRR